MKLIKSEKYIESYINSCNILFLCFNKINKDILNKIKLYLLEYATGFALFNKKIIIDNIEYNFEDKINYSINYVFRLLSKFPIIMNKKNTFSHIIQNINKVPNIQIVDLTPLYYILFKNRIIKYEIIDSTDFNEIFLLINKYICKLNIELGIQKYYIKNNDNLINNEIKKRFSLIFIIDNNNKYNNIEDIIIDNCGNYKLVNIYDNDINIIDKQYEMLLISHNNDILYIELLRMIYNKVIINKIITLPPFIFINNTKFYKYELFGLILYNNHLYSLIIKEKNNKFYHYIQDNIYEINDDEFDNLTAYNCTNIFYKKIN